MNKSTPIANHIDTWVIVGARLEERELVDDFADNYREYQLKVPMLFPRKSHPE
ncbi:MAG: hypothetical protein KAT61_04760 [Gammaproteobacteria bacterium]|nr:hypothetical protein [Gammaproteobacteria bacterium]